MDDEERGQLIAKVAADAAWLLESARRERAARHADGRDIEWLDQIVTEFESLAQTMHDLEVFRAIRAAVDQHGPGPYPVDELAIIADITLGDAQRMLDRMVAEGLATPPDTPRS